MLLDLCRRSRLRVEAVLLSLVLTVAAPPGELEGLFESF